MKFPELIFLVVHEENSYHLEAARLNYERNKKIWYLLKGKKYFVKLSVIYFLNSLSNMIDTSNLLTNSMSQILLNKNNFLTLTLNKIIRRSLDSLENPNVPLVDDIFGPEKEIMEKYGFLNAKMMSIFSSFMANLESINQALILKLDGVYKSNITLLNQTLLNSGYKVIESFNSFISLVEGFNYNEDFLFKKERKINLSDEKDEENEFIKVFTKNFKKFLDEETSKKFIKSYQLLKKARNIAAHSNLMYEEKLTYSYWKIHWNTHLTSDCCNHQNDPNYIHFLELARRTLINNKIQVENNYHINSRGVARITRECWRFNLLENLNMSFITIIQWLKNFHIDALNIPLISELT